MFFMLMISKYDTLALLQISFVLTLVFCIYYQRQYKSILVVYTIVDTNLSLYRLCKN